LNNLTGERTKGNPKPKTDCESVRKSIKGAYRRKLKTTRGRGRGGRPQE